MPITEFRTDRRYRSIANPGVLMEFCVIFASTLRQFSTRAAPYGTMQTEKEVNQDAKTRLKELRQERELTPSQAALAAGITRKTYLRYEEGTGRVKLAALVRLADFYACSMEYLLGHTDIRELP